MKKSEKIAEINAKLTADIAAAKAEKEQNIADYYAKVAELQRAACAAKDAADDDDPDEPQDNDQPTQWLNGEQWTAAVVARRVLNKLPKIPYNCSVDIALNHYAEDGISLQLKAYNPHRKEKCFEEVWLYKGKEPEKQAADISDWLERAGKLLAFKPTNDHVAEPLWRALVRVFGGNLPDDFPTLDRKEANNE